MSATKKSIYYFNAPGEQNTADCVRYSIERAQELGISKIVVASTSGATALKYFDALQGTGITLVVVTHVVGFSQPGVWEFDRTIERRLREGGAVLVTGTHVLSGLERALSRSPRIGGGSRSEAIAEALRRIIAVGLKVAVECVLIATDNGAVTPPDEVIAVGGTMSGADTVCVIRPSHTASFFDLQVREIVAMPRER
ncbi:MAG: hypothetical protein LUO82_03675 [Methanomicrobiales archaeon]|nr:hypothetical protein [Methanomicrobiales archaeon]